MKAAEKRVDKTNAKVGDIQQHINGIVFAELPKLQKELDKIAAEETELDAQISGRGFTNALGVVIPARPPL